MNPFFYDSSARVMKQLVEAMMFEKLVPAAEQGQDVWVWRGKSRLFKCFGRKSAFGRFRLRSLPVFVKNEDGWRDACLLDLVDELPVDHLFKQQLVHEFVRTIMLCEWNEEHVKLPEGRTAVPYEEAERLLIEGHPYHPCFKSRVGFSLSDHAAYGPEGGAAFPIQWVAVPHEELSGNEPPWKSILGELLHHQLLSEMEAKGVSTWTHSFFPVHPWQWKNSCSEWKTLVPLLEAGSYRATQSVRTLWNEENPSMPHVKLSMNMRQTSSVRTLHTPSLCAAPVISDWLLHIQQTDPVLEDIVMLSEFAGLAVEGAKGQLGVLWRESIRAHLRSGEEAIPFNALSMSEKSGRLLISPWIEQYGAAAWVEQLIKISVIPVWHLLCVHGIALEAHAQNMILIHENGWPVRVALRDFHESMEYVPSFLPDSSRVPDFNAAHEQFQTYKPDESYWMSSIEALRELAMDTLFVFHLSDVSFLLEEHGVYTELDFWTCVHQLVTAHVSRQPDWQKRHGLLKWDQPFIRTESLFSTKWSAAGNENSHLIPNILHAIKQEEQHAIY